MPSPPELIEALVVPRSESGHCIYEAAAVDSGNIGDFQPSSGRRQTAGKRLRSLGFKVHDTGGPALIVRGPQALFEKVFGARLVHRPHKSHSHGGVTTSYLEPEQTHLPGYITVRAEHDSELSQVVSGIATPRPVHLFSKAAVSPVAPSVPYHHFTVPDGVARAVNAVAAHRKGITGKGVAVAVCDSGVFPHPFFRAHGFKIRRMCTSFSTDGAQDPSGHGTAVAANLLSVAPGAHLISIKMNLGSGGASSADAIDALQLAARTRARVINCSWGQNIAEKSQYAADAVALGYVALWLSHTGRIVVAASGDYPRGDPKESGIYGWPAQHPTVIAAGGASIGPRGELTAASYASGFTSLLYAARYVPDVCGLCGDLPAGVLLMSPVTPGGAIDTIAAQIPYPNGDDTKPDDGWACFSGTSLAAPHISGAIALLLEANPAMCDTHLVRAALELTARNVDRGTSNPNASHSKTPARAHKGWNVATGAGLLDAGRLVQVARAMAVAPSSKSAVSPSAHKRSSPASKKGSAKPRR